MGYQPSLDGIRAVAVVAVLLYHADVRWLPGGFLGVDVFFVVSGYLITSLLVEERRGSMTTDLKRFWLRRAKRLLPGLFAMKDAVPIRFHDATIEAVKEFADADGVTVSEWIRRLVNREIEARRGQPSGDDAEIADELERLARRLRRSA